MGCWGWLEWVLGACGMAREHLHRMQQRPPASQHCIAHMDVRGGGKSGRLLNHLSAPHIHALDRRCYDFIAHDLSDNCFSFYEYARGRYALNGRVTFSGLAYLVLPFPVSRATGSCTRMFPSPFHMSSYLYKYGLSTRRRLLVCFMFLLLSRRLVSLRFVLMPFPFVVC